MLTFSFAFTPSLQTADILSEFFVCIRHSSAVVEVLYEVQDQREVALLPLVVLIVKR